MAFFCRYASSRQLTWLAGALLGLTQTLALSQEQGLVLRVSPRLQERMTDAEQREGPVYVQGDQITSRPDLDMRIEGHATLRRPGLSMQADELLYDQSQDKVDAKGHVRLSREGSRFEGPRLSLQVDSFVGEFQQPHFEILRTGGYGEASRMEFLDAHRSVVHDARYTTCRRTPGPEWLPEWLLKATQLQLDDEESVIRAEGVQLRFQDVPLITLPAVSFPMTDERKSGLLPPLVGIDTINGIDVMQPYYWNIAPNRDATVTTRLMSKRGVAVESELRYIERDYTGQARLNYMPSDSLRQQSRWGLTSLHNGTLDTGLDGIGRLGVHVALNRVSDDNYWRDFPRSGTGTNFALTQRLLPSTGIVSWARDNLSMTAQVQRWQALQDVSSPILPPYDRAPQLTLRYQQWNVDGVDVSVLGDTTRFETDYSRIAGTTAVARNGERSYVLPQISRSWVRPWGYITPKLQLHATRYQLDQPLTTGQTSVSRVLPTFSFDSGLTFEKETQWFGRDVLQTLEPRAFYARTPYRNQDALPVYDSGATDFNLSTIFSENPYVGQDRIVDNDSLTLGLTSRFFDARSGAEMLRVGLAQRMRFSSQQVVLPGQTAANSGLSDLLMGAGVRWDQRWTVDGAVQINNQTNQVTRTTLQLRYNPSPYRVMNLAYRLNRGVSEQIDVGGQWPLSDLLGGRDAQAESAWLRQTGQGLGPDRWYAVGRMNYSIKEQRLVDTILGLEYDAGCWLGRIVFERLNSTLTTSNTRLLFQLEFVGLAAVGSSPLRTLRDNIPRYQFLRDNTLPVSRFQHYE